MGMAEEPHGSTKPGRVAGGIRERCHGGPSRTVARRQRWPAAHGGPPRTPAPHPLTGPSAATREPPRVATRIL